MGTNARLRHAVAWARRTEGSRWWTTFLLAAALSSLWSLATPLFGAPDEPAHAIRAASVARLQVAGDEVPGSDNRLVVEAPKAYGDAADSIACYVYDADASAACAAFDDDTRIVRLPTSAGRHPPAYYLAAGIPSLAFRGALGVYLMRVVSTLITAAFVASAVATLGRLRRPRIGGLAVLVGATPMLFFIGGVVNPSAVELSAALCLWTAGTVLALEAPRHVDPKLLRRVGLAAIALVLSRQLSPLWLALVAVALVAIGGRAAVRALWRSHPARRWGAAIVGATVLQVIWIVVMNPLDPTLGDRREAIPGISTSTALQESFGDTLSRLREMVGWFGWLDTPSPGLTYALWTVAFAAVLVLGLVAWQKRLLLVAGGTGLAAIAAPLYFETVQAHTIGFFWQGRYSMPLALGVPVLLALSAATGDDDVDGQSEREARARSRAADRVVAMVAISVVIAQIAAYWQALRRNSIGYHGPYDFLLHPRWSPPVPPLLLMLLYVGVASLFALWVTIVHTTSSDTPVGAAQVEPNPSGSLRYS